MTSDDTNPMGTGDKPGGLLFGAARFEPGGIGLIRETVAAFRSAVDANRYATEQGWTDYQVSPLRFLVDSAPSDDGWRLRGPAPDGFAVRRRRVR